MYAEDYWQQYVHYNMDVQLDVVEKTVGGTSKIEYTNNSPDPLDYIPVSYTHLRAHET